MLKDGFTPAEVDQAKDGWLQSPRSRAARRISPWSGSWATTCSTGRTLSFDAGLEQRVAALTPDAIIAVMRRYLDPARS